MLAQDDDKSIFEYHISPYIQAGILLAAIFIFIVGGKLLDLMGLITVDGGTPWLISASFTLFYVIFNSVFSLGSDNQVKYYSQSITSYLALAFLGGGLAYLMSGISMDEAGSYRWLYIVFTIGYIIFLAIVSTMKRLVRIAQKQDKRIHRKK